MSEDFKDFFTYDRAMSNKFNKDQLVKKSERQLLELANRNGA